jgi:hypothetical protein
MKRFETTGPVELTVDIGAHADIWVVATERNEATVQIRPRNPARALDVQAAEQIEVELVGGRLLARLSQWRRSNWFSGGGAVELMIEVPTGSVIDVSSGMGGLTAEGELGRAVLRTGMGQIYIEHCAELRAKTGQGDVTVGKAVGTVLIVTGTGKVQVAEIDGSATIKNSNGETSVEKITGELRVSASNGDIVLGHAAGDVTARSANGAVRIAQVARGTVTAATAAGAIDVGVRPATAVWLDLQSGYGRVHNTLATANGPETTEETVHVRARTGYGDITVHRSTRTGP